MKKRKSYKPSAVKATKAPFQTSDMIKEIQDIIYNVSAKYLKQNGWDMNDIADYFYTEVEEVEPGVIRAEIRGELDYEELSGLCSQLDKVVAVKFDKDAYFEPVEPGIAEAFIHTNIQACTQVTASDEIITLDEVKSIIDGYGDKYFEAIPTTHENDSLRFVILDVGSYNIQLMDNRIVMTSIKDPFEQPRFFDTLGSFNGFMGRLYESRIQNTDETYTANASTEIKAYTFDETEDGWGEDIEEALSSVFARAEDLMYEVKNTVRGVYTDCETVEDLAGFIRQLASEFEEAADELESL